MAHKLGSTMDIPNFVTGGILSVTLVADLRKQVQLLGQMVTQLDECNTKLYKRVMAQQDRIDELEARVTDLEFAPGGPVCQEAKEHWDSVVKE